MLEYLLIVMIFIVLILVLYHLKRMSSVKTNMSYIFDILGISLLLKYRNEIKKPKHFEIKKYNFKDDRDYFEALNFLILGAGNIFIKAKKLGQFTVRELLSRDQIGADVVRGWLLKNMSFGFIESVNDKYGRFRLVRNAIDEAKERYMRYLLQVFGIREITRYDEKIEDPIEFLRNVSLFVSRVINKGSIAALSNDNDTLIDTLGIDLSSISKDDLKKLAGRVEKALNSILY